MALSRAQDEIRWNLTFPDGKIAAGADIASAKAALSDAFASKVSGIDPAAILSRAESKLQAALTGATLDVLRLFPGKATAGIAARVAGIEAASYINLVQRALRGEVSDALMKEISAALVPVMPSV